MPPATSCKKGCKKCPYELVLGAESTLSIQVDGITAIEYVRDDSAGGPGRALQGSNDLGNGIIVVQYATTGFEGEASIPVPDASTACDSTHDSNMNLCIPTTQDR